MYCPGSFIQASSYSARVNALLFVLPVLTALVTLAVTLWPEKELTLTTYTLLQHLRLPLHLY